MKKVLVIDGNYLCHRSYHAFTELSHKGIHTGTLYGFLRIFNTLLGVFKPDNVAVCWDSKKNIRKIIRPEYKEGREHVVDVDFVRKVMVDNGLLVNSFKCPGYEADDLLATIDTGRALCEVLIFSQDKDFFQLLDDDIHLLRFDKAKNILPYTQLDLYKDYGVRPWDWAIVKAIAGCTSDNVKGLDRVGEATAIKYISGTLAENTKAFKLIESDEGQQIIDDNLELVCLPLEGTPVCHIQPKAPISYDWWVYVCEDCGMKSLLNEQVMNNIDGYNGANVVFMENG